ncbi:endo-1,4-beta-xylanase [Roseateles violae]|uniref:Beta-xylanase n=1 Tax=Roseateles violae TaxID=3058042 RepID=A0ABT8E050_9BURK|nr:endo-1,4-beta-xylanase [Pelomonas sp. PFR6]MDN3923170.1 endo-1,4-beta-xylanase [Pelomonas sp. PFR6]
MLLSRRQFAALPLGLALPAGARLAATEPASLAQALGKRLPFGAAVTAAQLRDPAVAAFIAHQFGMLVAENAMKQESLSRGEGRYDFADADAIVDFARQRSMPVRGHALVWHHQAANWMFTDGAGEVSRATLVARLERYIADVVGHFRGRVFAWDVVNEAFQFDEPDAQTDAAGMRMSTWRRIIGPEFIAIAFRAAAKADPDALLFYNDYESQNPKKVAAMRGLVRDLRADGVRIDGIGHQMHCGRVWPKLADVADAIDALAAEGLRQHVTELDIALNDTLTGSAVQAATPELLQAQAQRYAELVNLLLSRRDKVSALLVWGIADAYSWLLGWPQPRFEAPLLFDTRLQPKPAYHAVLAAARAAQ